MALSTLRLAPELERRPRERPEDFRLVAIVPPL
jgi:hypothetical protein